MLFCQMREIKSLGLNHVKNLDDGIKNSNIILLLNNHRLNVKSNYFYRESDQN